MKPLLLFSLCFLVLGACSSPRPQYPEALTPDQALQSFQLREGFRIELFASEPQIADPVELVFDEFGRAYVVEMAEYPYPPKGPEEFRSRIRLLEDTDGDGEIDSSVLFADSLREATSIFPWKGGLLVTSAPHILYLKDTDGDNRADTREVIFSGFFDANAEAQITNLRYHINNWIYAANFGQKGVVTFASQPGTPPKDVQGSDFRFRLDRNEFEPVEGPTQFGHAMDDWGNRFIAMNTLHVRHPVIPRRYLQRSEGSPVPTALTNISDHEHEMFQETPPPYWRAERTRRRQQRYDEEKLDRTEYAEDHFTGSCGSTIYAGDAFPGEFYGNLFTGDVAGNLIHRDILIPLENSPTFMAKRDSGELDREFLSATDSWFRPANFTVGPDGYLYVVDMYRQHIETPLSIPEDLKEDMDFYKGETMGRIYRIIPENMPSQPLYQTYPGHLKANGLVKLLGHPNRWWRLNAQRLLVMRGHTEAIPLLKDMVYTFDFPQARLHALYALEGLNGLNAGLVKKMLEDGHPQLRVHAIQLAERFPGLLPSLIKMTDDPSPHVCLQLALSLSLLDNERAKGAIETLSQRFPEDEWIQMAVKPGDSSKYSSR